MSTLYIIGNGFDLWHELPTRWDQFHNFAEESLDELDLYFNTDTDRESSWSDFENHLGTFNWQSLFDEHNYIDVFAENFKPSEAFSLEDNLIEQADELVMAIREQFREWIEQIEISVVSKKMQFDKRGRFINFNYTSTLQQLYGINDDDILHIHGRFDAYEELVFGHSETAKQEPERDEYGNSNRTMFSDAEGAAKYPFYAFQKLVFRDPHR